VVTTGDDGNGDGNAREPGRRTADFGGSRLAILNKERTIADLGGPLGPTCKTSISGSNPLLASISEYDLPRFFHRRY